MRVYFRDTYLETDEIAPVGYEVVGKRVIKRSENRAIWMKGIVVATIEDENVYVLPSRQGEEYFKTLEAKLKNE